MLTRPRTWTWSPSAGGFPGRWFGDVSALALHDLIDGIPWVVDIAVPRGTRRPSIGYPPVQVAQYATESFRIGVQRYEVAPRETIPVYSAASCVVDAMRHRHRIGDDLALHALGRYVRAWSHHGGLLELQDVAKGLKALSIVRPAVEAILA